MKNQTIEEIKMEILELTNKVNQLESKQTNFNYATLLEWCEDYFEQKQSTPYMCRDLECAIELEDCCEVELSLNSNEIEIEKNFSGTSDIVEAMIDILKIDFMENFSEFLESNKQN